MIAVTVRRAVALDFPSMEALLTAKVAGISALDEIIADWGADALTFADLRATFDDQMPFVAIDGGGTLRGWNTVDHVTNGALPGVADEGWRSLYTVTDKTLAASDRLIVFGAMMKALAQHAKTGVHVFGDVRTPGRLDSFLANIFPHIAISPTVNRYYSPSETVVAKL